MENTPTTPLRVCSYPRSGNHLLMALLWANYRCGEAGKKVEAPNLRFYYDSHYDLNPFVRWAQLFGTHKHRRFLPEFDIEPKNVVYLIRDPRDVFRSIWWMRFGNLLPENYVTPKRIKAWRTHAREYQQAGALFVRYEDLVRDFESALAPIVERFCLKKRAENIAALSLPRLTSSSLYYGPLELGRVGWIGPIGPTSAAPPTFPKHVESRFAQVLGDEVFGYKLRSS